MKQYFTDREFDEFTVRFGAVAAEREAAYRRLHPRRDQIRRILAAVAGALSGFLAVML